MKTTNRVHAHKEDNPLIKTSFTQLIWDGMGKNKNGWVETAGAPAATSVAKGKADVDTEAAYRTLSEQAKGLATDGKQAEALAKYEEAQKLKDSPYLKGVITKLRTAVNAGRARTELLLNAETSFNEGDYDTAIELFTGAQQMEETPEVAARIAAAQAKDEESLTA